MPSNFDFLSANYPDLFNHATEAETLVYTAPRASCFYSRFTLEQAVLWLYTNDAYLKLPYDNSLGALIHEQTFKDNLKPGLFPKIRAIHKIGNIAVHDSTPIKDKDALHTLEELFHFLYWLSRSYSSNAKNHPSVNFESNLIPHTANSTPDLSLQQLQTLEVQLSQADQMRQIAEARQQRTEQELTALKAEIAALKQQNADVPDTHNYNEAATRHYLIDVLLKEAGWNIDQAGWREYEVQGMPNDTGIGRVDYVLWGDDGKPLAVIEAKRTRKSPEAGKHQAKLYADCLEQRFGQRPLIFYTNGYDYWIWDDRNYPPREIQGFLKKDELERLIFRRSHRKRLHLVNINPSIVERSYQNLAIRSITEAFDHRKERKALLVMATGTGKTRTAIALVDMLMRANWVKRVLFLADRNALITQALRAFKRHLTTATEEFSERSRWDILSETDVDAIAQSLAQLPNGLPQENHLAKRFDLLCLRLQITVLTQSKDFIKFRDQVRDLLHRLEEKQTIPMVKAKLELIADIQTESWWQDITPELIEQMRRQLRDLVKFIDPQEQQIVYTNFEDELGEIVETDVPTKQTGFSPYQYRKKVEAYIREHENHIA